MSREALKFISESMKELGFNYHFGELKGQPKYPYFVGEYQEVPPIGESGGQDTQFMITGFTRVSWNELEQAKGKIKDYFNKTTGKTAIADNNSVVAVFYESSSTDLTGDAELKKIQINLLVKEWSVN